MINSSAIADGNAAEESQDKEKNPSDNEAFDPSEYVLENGKYCYTDPATNTKYAWDHDKKVWLTVTGTIKPEMPQGMQDYEFEGGTYIYTDSASGVTYRWDPDKLIWYEGKQEKKVSDIETLHEARSDEEEFDDDDDEAAARKKTINRQDMSQGTYDFDGTHHTYTDTKDGTVYFWDREKNAWFPKVDDDFLAQYQMNYGFNTPEADAPTLPPPKPSAVIDKIEKPVEGVKRKQDPTWFEVDDKTNTKVYVSNLPTELTENEFVELMQKCGLVMKDPDNGKMKVKMYMDSSSGTFKGDALCTYIKVESVDLALKILDGYDVKGKKIKVERAKFTMKGGSYDPSLKPKKKRKKDLAKLKKIQERLFDWRPEKMRGERDKSEKVVIVKNLFDPSIFDDDVGLILEYQQDLREECTKCGRVSKVTVYDRHPEGVAQINFKEPEAADACILLLNNRWFGKRQITAETWDGKTKYKVAETEEQKKARMAKWEKFIQDESKKGKIKEKQEDSGEETRSSAGSGDDTDEEKEKTDKSKTNKSESLSTSDVSEKTA